MIISSTVRSWLMACRDFMAQVLYRLRCEAHVEARPQPDRNGEVRRGSGALDSYDLAATLELLAVDGHEDVVAIVGEL